MRNGLFVLALLSFAQMSFASESYHPLTDLSFGAPVVTNTSDVSNKFQGQIVFDQSTGAFKGYSDTGTWTALSGPAGTGNVVSGGTERIERATITNNGTCAVSSQSGTWISSVTNTATGVCSITLNGTPFNTTPACTCSVVLSGGSGRVCQIQSQSNSTIVTWTDLGSGGDENRDFNIICMGPQN